MNLFLSYHCQTTLCGSRRSHLPHDECSFFIHLDYSGSRWSKANKMLCNPGIRAFPPHQDPFSAQILPQMASWEVNFLSKVPRPHHQVFYTWDPGLLSGRGARHDNDHVDIKDIQILPTADEILSIKRPPFIPEKNLKSNHHLRNGFQRHIDILFRHLRYEYTECLRDICYHAAQEAFMHYKTHSIRVRV